MKTNNYVCTSLLARGAAINGERGFEVVGDESEQHLDFTTIASTAVFGRFFKRLFQQLTEKQNDASSFAQRVVVAKVQPTLHGYFGS